MPAISLAVFLLAAAIPAAAAAPHVTATLVAEDAWIQPGHPCRVGIRLVMAPGWHTYWKNPGDSGLATRVAWRMPPGFSAGPIEWPAPSRIEANTLISYGYRDDVVLPVRITPPVRLDADSVVISATVDWLECAEACLPGTAALRLAVPVRNAVAPPGPDHERFAPGDAATMLPDAWAFAGVSVPEGIALTFRAPEGSEPDSAYLFVDRPLVADYDAPQTLTRSDAGYRLLIPTAPNAPGPPDRLTGVLVVHPATATGKRTAVPVDVAVAGAASAAADSAGSPPGVPWRTIFIVIAGVAIAVTMPRFLRTGSDPSRHP